MERIRIGDLRSAAEVTGLSLNTNHPSMIIGALAVGAKDLEDREQLGQVTAYLYSKYGVWYTTYFDYGFLGIFEGLPHITEHQGYQDGKSCRPLLHDLVLNETG